MTDFPIPPEAVEAARRAVGFADSLRAFDPEARDELVVWFADAALTAAIPHLLPAYEELKCERDRWSVRVEMENKRLAADRDRWRAMAERLGEALQPICDRYPASAIPATMNAAGDAALRDLQAMKGDGS